MIEDYAKHAAVWDWDGYDNSAEYDYWCGYASKYGMKVLIPMCAARSVRCIYGRKRILCYGF